MKRTEIPPHKGVVLALTECEFVMRGAEGSSVTKLCMVVHSADPLLYLQAFHLPEHSREEGEAPVKMNTVNQRERLSPINC